MANANPQKPQEQAKGQPKADGKSGKGEDPKGQNVQLPKGTVRTDY